VFSSVDRAALGDLKLDGDVTGIWLNVDWAGTLEAALRLQPGTRRVVVITGTSATDRVWQAAARRQLDVDRYRGVAIEYVSDLAVDQVLQRVAALSQGTIVLFGAFTATRPVRIFSERKSSGASPRAQCPVYGPGETYIGGGIVGGLVVSFTRKAHGPPSSPRAYSVAPGPVPSMARRTCTCSTRGSSGGGGSTRHGCRPGARCASGSRRSGISTNGRYGRVACGAPGALIVGLLVNRRQRRRAQRALAERLRFETLVSELSPPSSRRPRDVPGQIEKRSGASWTSCAWTARSSPSSMTGAAT
jgi:hypothetical protein